MMVEMREIWGNVVDDILGFLQPGKGLSGQGYSSFDQRPSVEEGDIMNFLVSR
jgi:hypothetical protein